MGNILKCSMHHGGKPSNCAVSHGRYLTRPTMDGQSVVVARGHSLSPPHVHDLLLFMGGNRYYCATAGLLSYSTYLQCYNPDVGMRSHNREVWQRSYVQGHMSKKYPYPSLSLLCDITKFGVLLERVSLPK